MKDINPKNIFDLGETRLFYKRTSNKTFAFIGEDCSSGKRSKEIHRTHIERSNRWNFHEIAFEVEQFRKKERNILLFIDNCTTHNSIPEMKNVKVEFSPANITSNVQLMHQGIITN